MSANLESNQSNAQSVSINMELPSEHQTTDKLAERMAMLQMIYGFMISQAIYVAAKLGIADLLKDGPRSTEELAQATSMHAPSLYRVLRTLSTTGVFTETETEKFALTSLGEMLRTDAEGSLRPLAVCMGGQCNWQAWGDVLHSVKTGESAFEHVFGVGFFQHLDRNPDNAKMFVEAANCCAQIYNAAITEAYDFSSLDTIIDVGGGQGSLLAAILKANPEANGILFDTPNLTPVAERLFEQEGVAERCQTITGDFLESVPPGGAAYILKHIIRAWSDEHAVEILKNCRREMKKDARLLLMEEIISSDNEPSPGKLLDLQLLLMHGGRERTQDEYGKLLEAAGFELTRVVRTGSSLSIIEAKPA